MSTELGSSQPSANERMRPPAKGGWRERYESGRTSPERLLARRSAEKKKAEGAQELPKTPLDLLADKLLSLEGDKVQREKLRNDIAEAEQLLEQLKQEHEPNIIAIYEKTLRINERLGVARHLADVYEQIASWGEAARLETHLEEGGEVVNPHPLDAREEAISRYKKEKELKEQRSQAYKKLGQIDRGRTDEDAQETKGLQADDLTLPYKDRIAFAESKITKRFSKVKGREPTREELDQLIYGQKQAGHSPLSLRERTGQWFRRLGEVTLGGAFDRFADTSITQAVADYKKLEDEERAATEAYEKLDHELVGLQKTRERIQEQAKKIDPEKQRAEEERVKARFKMETPTRKELVKEGRRLSKEEEVLAKKRRLLAREPSQPGEEPLTLKSIRQGGKEALELERLAEKKRADAEATKALDLETFRSKIDQGVRKWRVAQFKALAKEEPGAVDPNSEEGQEQENIEIRRLIDSFKEKRSALLAGTENGTEEERLEATERLFFGRKGALESDFDEYGLPKKLPRPRPYALGKVAPVAADKEYELGPDNASKIVNDDGTEISFGADEVSVDLSEPQKKPVAAGPGLFRRAGENLRKKAQELAVASSLAQEPSEDFDAPRARGVSARVHDAPEQSGMSSGQDWSATARESSTPAQAAVPGEALIPEEVVQAKTKNEPLKNSVDIFEEPPALPPSVEPRRAKYLDAVRPLDLDAHTPVVSFKSPSQPAAPKAAELSPSDLLALSKAAEKKARKGQKALEASKKQRGIKGDKTKSASSTPQAEVLMDTSSAVRNESARSADDEAPEVSFSEDEELIIDPEAVETPSDPQRERSNPKSIETLAELPDLVFDADAEKYGRPALSFASKELALRNDGNESDLDSALEEEASSVLNEIVDTAKKLPVGTPPAEQAQKIKALLDKIPFTQADWKESSRSRALAKLRQTKESYTSILQQGDLGEGDRESLMHRIGILDDVLALTSWSSGEQDRYIAELGQKPELAVSDELREKIRQRAEDAKDKKKEEQRIAAEKQRQGFIKEVMVDLLSEFRHSTEWNTDTLEAAQKEAASILKSASRSGASDEVIQEAVQRFSDTQRDNWKKDIARKDKSARNKIIMSNLLLGRPWDEDAPQTVAKEAPSTPPEAPTTKERPAGLRLPSPKTVQEFFGHQGYREAMDELRSAFQAAFQDAEKKEVLLKRMPVSPATPENMAKRYMAYLAIPWGLHFNDWENGHLSPIYEQTVAGLNTVDSVIGINHNELPHPIPALGDKPLPADLQSIVDEIYTPETSTITTAASGAEPNRKAA